MGFKEFLEESAIDKEKAFWQSHVKDIPQIMSYTITAQGISITDKSGKRFLTSISSYEFTKNKMKFKDIITYAEKKLKEKPIDNTNPKKVNFGGAIPTWGLD
jgi:hypothetical protein